MIFMRFRGPQALNDTYKKQGERFLLTSSSSRPTPYLRVDFTDSVFSAPSVLIPALFFYRKQMSFQPVLTVKWGCRYGWKLPTGSAGRAAHAEEEPRLYLRGRAVAGAGHRGEHRHLHHYQRGLPAPAPGRGTLAAGGNVYPRHPNDRCQYQFSAHRHFAPQLPGLPRPEHGFLRPGDGHLSHTPELGRPSRAATIERFACE